MILRKDLFLLSLCITHYHLTQRLVVGDASETALLKFTELTIGNVMDYRNRFKKALEVPFNSTNKFQVRAGLCFFIFNAVIWSFLLGQCDTTVL